MKNLLLFLIFTLLLSSCNNYVEDINVDPNAPTDADAKNMLQGVLLGNQFWQTASTSRLVSIWMNQATGADRQYIALNNWNSVQATDFDGDWGTAYSNTIYHAKLLEEKALVEGNPKLAGVAKAVRAYAFGMMTSLYGDIPFTQASNSDVYPNPAYDSQASVYSGVQTMLDQAIVLLNTSSTINIPADKDFVYGGVVSKWVKFTHAAKARFYLHVKNYAAANTEAQLGMSSPSDDYKAYFGTTYGGSFNPYYSFLVYDRPGYMSADDSYAVFLLNGGRNNSKTDETLRFNYTYLDLYEIYNTGYELNFLSMYDWGYPDGKFGTETPMPLLTYGEMLLIQAEYQARQNGLSAGVTAYNSYRDLLRTGYSIGINNDGYADLFGSNFAASVYSVYVDADFQTGGEENADNIVPVQALLREIYEERYVYFIANFESFTDFRRTNNIAEIDLKAGYANSPQRLIYPQSEINSNTSTPSPIPNVTVKTPIYQ